MSILYGGDYNPEQWSREVWDADYRAFDTARINTLTVGVFAWAYTQPADDTYDFSLLDEIVARAVAEGRHIVLGTGTGALPPWLAHEHPEVTRVDFEGRKHRFGQRHNPCPSSPVYRGLSAALAEQVAQRYSRYPEVVAWHIGNEYGGADGACYCDNCAAAFRGWLRDRYQSLDRLNEAWYGMFWSHRFTDWEQIEVPSALTEHWKGPRYTAFQGITIDYLRFMSDAMLANFRDEKAAIRRHDTTRPVTTNFMGAFRPLDYHRWAEELDFASWDNYPPGPREEVRMAFAHDLMRGLKDGAPFWVMEQTPTITASRDVNPVKRPGVMGLWSWQSVAHGADAVLFFQMRQSRGACEKYHGAVIDHSGRLDTRAFTEVGELGGQLERVGPDLVGGRTPAKVALLFDWDSWWAVEITDGFNRHVSYLDTVLRHYGAAWRAGADVDVVPTSADLSAYDVVLAPALHVVKDDIVAKLDAVLARGGSVVSGFYAGRVDEGTNAILGEVTPWHRLFGIRLEETDSLEPGAVNPVGLPEVHAEGELVMEVISLQGADPFGTYEAEFYAGTPAVTRHRPHGETGGQAWYLATLLDLHGTDAVIGSVLRHHGLTGPYAHVDEVEHTTRVNGRNRYSFLLNHSDEARELAMHVAGTDLMTGDPLAEGQSIVLRPKQVLIVQESPAAG